MENNSGNKKIINNNNKDRRGGGVDISRDLRLHRDRSPEKRFGIKRNSRSPVEKKETRRTRFGIKKNSRSPVEKKEIRRSLSEDRDYRKTCMFFFHH